jgi:hypothetical protein
MNIKHQIEWIEMQKIIYRKNLFTQTHEHNTEVGRIIYGMIDTKMFHLISIFVTITHIIM